MKPDYDKQWDWLRKGMPYGAISLIVGIALYDWALPVPEDEIEDEEPEPVDPTLCERCGFKGTPLCTHPDGYYQDEPAGLNKVLTSV